MATTTKKTAIEYPVSEFIKLLKDKFGISNCDASVKFIIQEVRGDYCYHPQVVAVQICYEEKSQ